MSWQIWEIGTTEEAQQELSDMIFNLMKEVVFELDDPGFNEWFEAGVDIGNKEYDTEEIIVYRELQETDMTDVDGTMRPGYTLTLQLSDGQQETETFFEDDTEEYWRECADYFAKIVVDHIKYVS